MVRERSNLKDVGSILLRRHRAKLGMSQKGLGKLSKVSFAYISELERSLGKIPSLKVLNKLSQAMNLEGSERTELIESYHPTGPIFEPVVKDKQRRKEISSIWIVSDHPEELVDKEYLRILEDNIQRDVPHTYWMNNTRGFDSILKLVSPTLQGAFNSQVKCIKTPKEANWFKFVVYDPLDPELTNGRHLFTGLSGHTTHTAPIDQNSLNKIVKDLSQVVMGLQFRKEPYRGVYSLHFPER